MGLNPKAPAWTPGPSSSGDRRGDSLGRIKRAVHGVGTHKSVDGAETLGVGGLNLPPLAQFSPRKFAPRLSLLLVGEASRIGLAPWLSSRNETRRLRSRALPQIASSRRESSHQEPQAFCWWAKLLDLG